MSWDSLNALEHAMLWVVCAIALVLVLQTMGLMRAQRRVRALGAELGRMQLRLLGIERLQYEADQRGQRDSVRLDQLEHAQRRSSAGFAKPDAQLTLAMIRAGADARALLDCGLSHGESHLMHAIHSRPAVGHRETESTVLSSAHEH